MNNSVDRQKGEFPSTASESFDAWLKSVGDVSAPVLAGFSITVVIVVSDNAGSFRWPGWAILALTAAATTLIATLQCARHALRSSWPRADETRFPKLAKHVGYLRLTEEERVGFWRKRTRSFYHSGLTALLAGLALTLAPPSGAKEEGLRWLASSLALLACLVEALVFLANSYLAKDKS